MNAAAGEFVTHLDTVDPAQAAALRAAQQAAGRTAYTQGEAFQGYRPQAWQEGWFAACKADIAALTQALNDD